MKRLIHIVLLLGLVALLVTGCGGGLTAQDEDKVKVHYTGTLEDGTEFDSSVGGEPLAFTMGAGQLISGFENAVQGMKVGEKKTVTIPAAEAYGEPKQELIFAVPLDKLPEEADPNVGDQVQMTTTDGQMVIGTVTEITELSITVDANHRLAGKDLIFEIEIVEITR